MTKNIVIKKKSKIRNPIVKKGEKGKKSKITNIVPQRYDINLKKNHKVKRSQKKNHILNIKKKK